MVQMLLSPCVASFAFLRTHGSKLEPENRPMAQEHVVTLRNEQLAFLRWMQSVQPPPITPVTIGPPLVQTRGHAEASGLT